MPPSPSVSLTSASSPLDDPPRDRSRREETRRDLAGFFDAYFDRLYRFVFRLLGNRSDAEDVSQEIFLKVCRARQSEGGDDELPEDAWPWLVTVASNACRDHWRSGKRAGRRAAPMTEAMNEIESPTVADPLQDSIQTEDSRAIHGALDALPHALRLVVVMREFERMSHDEIAATLSISSAASRKRFSRGMQELARTLGNRSQS